MNLRPRVVCSVVLAGLMSVCVVEVGDAGTSPPPATLQPSSEPAPSDVVITDTESDLESIDPTSGEVVHSWALAPAGSNDTDGANNRPNLSYDGQPGDVIEDAVTLFNLGNEQLTFNVYATDAFNNPSGAFDLLPGDSVPLDVGSWVSFAQQVITVAPGRAVTIPITVTIPGDASPGDHVGGILASSEALSSGEGGQAVVLDRRTGTRLFVRVAGPIQAEVAVENLESSYTPAPNPLGGSSAVSYRIQNRGNITVSGQHFVKVEGPLGLGSATSAQVDLPLLLPGQGVDITAEVDRIPALVVAYTDVEFTPTGDDVELVEVVSNRQTDFAPPVTLVLVLTALALGLLLRRNVRRRRAVPGGAGRSAPAEVAREPQLT